MWDFQELLRLDVVDFFTGERSWMEFWGFFNGLPSSSRTKAAISSDPEIAEAELQGLTEKQLSELLEQRAETTSKPPEPMMEGYTLEIAKMDDIVNSVEALSYTIKTMFGSKSGSKFEPRPRPTSEREKMLNERVDEYENSYRKDFEAELGF